MWKRASYSGRAKQRYASATCYETLEDSSERANKLKRSGEWKEHPRLEGKSRDICALKGLKLDHRGS